MKRIFYLSVSLFLTISMSAQSPGGVAGSVLWLKANTAGTSGAAWPDASGLVNDFTQITPGNQPALNGNIFNFNVAMGFNGGSSYMTNATPTGFPTGNNDRTIFVVANATAVDAYRWIFLYGTPGPPFSGTFQTGNHDGTLTNAFYGSTADMSTPGNYWNLAQNANGTLAAYTLDLASNTETQYDKGLSINASAASTTLLATSTNGVVGALLDPGPKEFWAGSIGEIILFPSFLSSAARNQVESYLALKYGFTLGTIASPFNYTASDGTTVYWTASATYQNDVFGVGSDATGTGLTQQQSNSMNSGSGDGTGQMGKGNLVLTSTFSLNDKQFVMIGNDAGTFAENTIAGGEAPAVAVGSQRVARNWKVQNTGAVSNVSISFDISGLTLAGGTTASSYRLMLDEDGDGDYTTGTQSFYKATGFTGNKLNFNDLVFGPNAVFTIITQASTLLPALWQGFTATLDRSTAVLTWKTSNEINVDHYTVEYSTNGTSFTPAGTVVAKNGTGTNTYSLSQDNLPAGTRYYRIKRVDKDGNFVFSDIKSVRAGGFTTLLIKSNPIVKGRLELIIDAVQNQDAVIRIVSVSGKIIAQQHNGLTTGSNSISTNVVNLASGTYFVQVQLAKDILNKKFVKQ